MKPIVEYVKRNYLPLILLLVSAVLFLYKLDYEYFFTDEILYSQSGYEYLAKHDYSLNLQHPFLAKYIAGIATMINNRDVFVMRLPFALIGIASALVVYKILEEQYGKKRGFLGGLLFVFSPYLYSSIRMVMMESPMIFFWLMFHLFFLRFLKTKDRKNAVLSGIMLGLGIGTKSNSLILYPFSLLALIIFKLMNKQIKFWDLKNYIWIPVISFPVFGLTYTDLLLRRGVTGLTNVLRSIKDVLITRNSEGKIHVIGNKVYLKSPSWYYFYFIDKTYSLPQKIFSGFTVFSIFYDRSFFTIYWFLFLLFNVAFAQIITLKNERYLALIELCLVFLSVVLINHVYNVISKLESRLAKKILAVSLSTFLSVLVIFRFYQLSNIRPTSYNALYKYLVIKTNNFTNGDRTYILGSIRSSRWYFQDVSEDQVVSRKDFGIMSPEFPNFKYIVFDRDELLKDPNNLLYTFIITNRNNYDLLKISNLDVYVRK